MSNLECTRQATRLPSSSEVRPIDEEVVELAVLVPRAQFLKLERQATRMGISVGQLVRHRLFASSPRKSLPRGLGLKEGPFYLARRSR
ncbi:MAG: hypothetical protein L0Z62_12005 [Gemmataceae bacterium]|nr:hypothetical protein [Gemmataceae bacterium]